MKIVYIAGAFRGKDAWVMETNVREAEKLALEVWRAGAGCVCPHANTRFFQGVLPDDFWLRGDIGILALCDALLMVPGWERSEGATAEHAEALRLGIPVFYYLEDLEKWLDENQQMSPDQEAHLRRVKAHILRRIDAKYRAGQREHGGNLWKKPGVLEMLLDELVDACVYAESKLEQDENPGIVDPALRER